MTPIKKIAILTSKGSWFNKYSVILKNKLKSLGYETDIFNEPDNIDESYDVVFILSYYKILTKDFLAKHKHNIVIHGSDLPKGRGWSPITWQVLEGKNKIPITLFEADEGMDTGDVYIRDYVMLDGDELLEEIRNKAGEKIVYMALKFITEYNKLKPQKQVGEPTYYRKRTPKDSELDINKTIKEQFNLLRIVDNERYPAFFYMNGKKYIIKIYKASDDTK